MPNVEDDKTQETIIAVDDSADKPLTKTELMGILKETLPQMITGAVTNHVKRMTKKAPVSSETTEEQTETLPANESKEVAKLQRQVADLLKQNKQANEAARKEKLTNKIGSLVKDKVASDWHDVAVDKLSSKVQFQDEQPEILINDLPYSLEDGVAEWLRDPSNKRFLPVPKVARQGTTSTGREVPATHVSYGTNPNTEMGIDEAAVALAGSLASEGKSLRDLIRG